MPGILLTLAFTAFSAKKLLLSLDRLDQSGYRTWPYLKSVIGDRQLIDRRMFLILALFAVLASRQELFGFGTAIALVIGAFIKSGPVGLTPRGVRIFTVSLMLLLPLAGTVNTSYAPAYIVTLPLIPMLANWFTMPVEWYAAKKNQGHDHAIRK